MARGTGNSVSRLRIGTWNLDRARPRVAEGQRHLLAAADADLWLLTEAPIPLALEGADAAYGVARDGDAGQCWSAIWSPHPIRSVTLPHPALTLAQVALPIGDVLAACSVFPWRGAQTSWPDEEPGFRARVERCLAAHVDAIVTAAAGRPVIWGGDFNQALEGREYVGAWPAARNSRMHWTASGCARARSDARALARMPGPSTTFSFRGSGPGMLKWSKRRARAITPRMLWRLSWAARTERQRDCDMRL